MARMRQASRQASRLWKLLLMLWKVHLARQASRQAGLEAVEIAMDAIDSGAKQTLG